MFTFYLLLLLPFAIAGRILTTLSVFFVVVLPILKLVGAVQMEWFGTVTALSALGTPLWMFLIGKICLWIAYLIGIIAEDVR